MEVLQLIIALLLIVSGSFLLFIGSVGIIRLPDFYARIHTTGKVDTFGIMMVLTGLAVYEGFTLTAAKLLLAVLFVSMANPIGTHALAKAAMRSGLKPWFPSKTTPNDGA
jgi:multicomponent Na+:H+ antiporter subunit G